MIWGKVFKNRPSQICGRQSLKSLKCPYHFNFFKGCLPQIPLGLILNTLSHLLHPTVKRSFGRNE